MVLIFISNIKLVINAHVIIKYNILGMFKTIVNNEIVILYNTNFNFLGFSN